MAGGRTAERAEELQGVDAHARPRVAREAEEQLGHVLRERAREAKARGSGGGTGIDYRTFDEWKRKYEEQKEQNSGLNVLG